MILSDQTIREQIAAGRIVIDPYDDALVQPSIDVRISHLFRVFRNHTAGVIDVKSDMTISPNSSRCPKMVQSPSCCIRASSCSVQHSSVPEFPMILLAVEGKSSLGRLGLLIHSTLGFSTPGLMVT